MTKSILKRMPDVIEHPDEESGGKKKYFKSDWILCLCTYCDNIFMVKTTLSLICPHGCGDEYIEIVWGKPEVVFVCEHEPIKLKEIYKKAMKEIE